jgi:hypothetical protein
MRTLVRITLGSLLLLCALAGVTGGVWVLLEVLSYALTIGKV